MIPFRYAISLNVNWAGSNGQAHNFKFWKVTLDLPWTPIRVRLPFQPALFMIQQLSMIPFCYTISLNANWAVPTGKHTILNFERSPWTCLGSQAVFACPFNPFYSWFNIDHWFHFVTLYRWMLIEQVQRASTKFERSSRTCLGPQAVFRLPHEPALFAFIKMASGKELVESSLKRLSQCYRLANTRHEN